jgi:hypothetical protein
VEGVLGVWMAPTTLRMVLVEGENADGVTVKEENVERAGAGGPATRSGPDQVISAILGTREAAAESGYQLRSTGVTWTYPGEAAALRDALANRKIENVTLVSAFLAAAALAQEVGNATGYRRTALLFVELHTATLAVVDTADGSIVDVRRRLLRSPDLVAELVAMISGAQALRTRADGLFVVGSGVDVAPIKPALQAATSLAVSTPKEPETALARGAALASAHAPLFTSSTDALAYAKDPGIGAIGPYGVAPPGHFDVPAGAGGGEGALAYSAVAYDEANAYTTPDFIADQKKPERGPLWVVASAVAAIFVVGVVALVIALAMSNRPNVGTRFNPSPDPVVPTNPAPVENTRPPGAPASSPAPAAPPPAVTAPAPAPPAVPPVVPRVPIYNPPSPPAQLPGDDRHGGGGHGEGGGHGGGGGHGEGEGHGGGGGSGY